MPGEPDPDAPQGAEFGLPHGALCLQSGSQWNNGMSKIRLWRSGKIDGEDQKRNLVLFNFERSATILNRPHSINPGVPVFQ